MKTENRRRRLKALRAKMVVPPTRVERTVDEWVLIAEERAKMNDGVLEHSNWLQLNGFAGLQQSMLHHPAKFSHIKQDKKRTTVDEWIRIAELRAKKNGSLENPKWLIKNGLNGLYQAMRLHPRKFAHIKRTAAEPTPRERLDELAKFAKTHGGMGPSSESHEYLSLRVLMGRHRRLLLHKFKSVGKGPNRKWVLR